MTNPIASEKARAERMDRKWFDRRPGKFIRVRPALFGEFSPPTSDFGAKERFVIVLRQSDGTILKVDLFAVRMPDQDEASLTVLFDLVDEHLRRGTVGAIPEADVQEATLAANFLASRDRLIARLLTRNGGTI